jgi:hypothetical protein
MPPVLLGVFYFICSTDDNAFLIRIGEKFWRSKKLGINIMLNKKLLSLFCQNIDFDWYMRILTFSVIILAIRLLGACATIPVEKRAGLREEINLGADKTIEKLISRNPELQESIDTMEYNGFIGSREAFITSVTRRF